MISTEIDDSNKSESEKFIYNEIKKSFDESRIVFHSYILEGKNKERKLINAEIDFLFLHKSLVILVMEVKGGQIIKCSQKISLMRQKSFPILMLLLITIYTSQNLKNLDLMLNQRGISKISSRKKYHKNY